jgi:DNA-binding PadR family transcriptional regulator
MPEHSALDTIVLAAVSDRARYGYELTERIAELTDGQVSVRPGNLYRIIHRLAERGLVVERAAAAPGEDERRRYFHATAAGRRFAADELAMYARVLKRASALRELLHNA